MAILDFLQFSAKRDLFLLMYKLVDLHESIFYLNALKNEDHWGTSK